MTPSVSTSRSPQLQDDQKFALMKFRRSVHDILKAEHDDFYLLRWLRARSWNAEAAEKMLRDQLKWRERWDVDNILSWKVPKVCDDYCPRGLCGFDKEGSPVIVCPFAGMDMWGMLHTVSRGDIIRITMQTLEQNLKLAFEQSKIHGINARQLVVIFDMQNFNLKQYLWRPATEVVISLIKMYEANYPEILKCCYIINAPKIFAFGFNIIKKFLDEYTLSKIQIVKADQKKWLPMILERIDPSQIPQYYGGTMVDEDGDPKCSKFIQWGGKVPKEMYTNKDDKNETLKEDTIKKGGKIKLDFECKDSGCFLRWEFRTIEHDIRFGVKCLNLKTEEVTEEIPVKRVTSHELDEIGFIACQPDCKYTVIFDNSYSYLRNKTILYNVVLTASMDEIESAAGEIQNSAGEIENSQL